MTLRNGVQADICNDFHPFEFHRVGSLIIVTDSYQRFAALGTWVNGEIAIVRTYRRRRTRKERGLKPLSDAARQQRNLRKVASRTRRRAEARAVKRKQEINVETIGDALPKEMTRIRDEVMPAYIAIGPSGRFALAMMRADLNAAAKAMAEGDVVEMLRVYKALREYRV